MVSAPVGLMVTTALVVSVFLNVTHCPTANVEANRVTVKIPPAALHSTNESARERV
jgi:hypothetical protein